MIGRNFVRTEVRLFPPDSLQWSLLIRRLKSVENQLECSNNAPKTLRRIIQLSSAQPQTTLFEFPAGAETCDVTEQAARLATRCF